MLRKLRPRSAYDVVALLALFVALGGTTYAAATIGAGDIKDNAVRSRHIKDAQVKNSDLAANSVATGKVIDHSLLKRDFKAGQLPKGDTGPQGPGAVSLDGQVELNDFDHQVVRTIDGIDVEVFCGKTGDSVSIELKPVDASHSFYGFGTGADLDRLFRVTSEGQGYISAGSASRIELYAVAHSTAAGEALKYTSFDLSVLRGSKCNFHGLIVPGGPAG